MSAYPHANKQPHNSDVQETTNKETKEIFDFSKAMWHIRNTDLHGEEVDDICLKKYDKQKKMVKAAYDEKDNIYDIDGELFELQLNKTLKLPPTHLKAWRSNVCEAKKASILRRKRSSRNEWDIRSYLC